MHYELTLLDRLFAGDLAPDHFQPDQADSHSEFLRHRFGSYFRRWRVQLNRDAVGEFAFHTHTVHAFLELDELPPLPGTPWEPDEAALGRLLTAALPWLGATHTQVRQVRCARAGHAAVLLDLTTEAGYDRLPPAQARYYHYHTQLLDEVARLRRALPAAALACPDAPAQVRYVRHYQQALRDLLDRIAARLAPAHITEMYAARRDFSATDLYRLLYVQTEKLLLHLTQAFPAEASPDTPLTYGQRVALSSPAQPLLSRVQTALAAAALPPSLTAELAGCFRHLAPTRWAEPPTGQQVRYATALLEDLHRRLRQGWQLTPVTLGHLLIRHDFNSSAFFHLVTDHLTQELAAADTLAERLRRIARYTRLYKQLRPLPAGRYVPRAPRLRRRLLAWLRAERVELAAEVATPAGAPAEAPRILSPLSVAQMAHLLRTLHDAGVFGQANQRDLFRLLAANFRTARQEQISEKSLAAHYYNAEAGTRQAVEKLVAKMLDQLRESSN